MIDGVDFTEALRGADVERSPMFTYLPSHGNTPHWLPPSMSVHVGDWKLIRVDNQPPLLFNLEQDLGETANLAPHYPQQVNYILSLYDEWEEGLSEPLWISEKIWRDRQVAKHKMDVIGRDAERKIP